METGVRVVCLPGESVFVTALGKLAQLVGVSIQVETISSVTPVSQFAGSQIVLVSAACHYLVPQGAVTVLLPGEFLPPPPPDCSSVPVRTVLLLPQDEPQVISLLNLRPSRGALVVGIQALNSGVASLPVAALLAKQFSKHYENTVNEDTNYRNGSVFPSAALIDKSGGYLPLQRFLGLKESPALNWSDLRESGQLVPSRLAAALPVWQGVSLLGQSGFLGRAMLAQSEQVLRCLSQVFSILVLDMGSGQCGGPDLDTRIYVGNYARESMLAWQEVNGDADHLILWREGGLPKRQFYSIMTQYHPEATLWQWQMSPRHHHLWSQDNPSRLLSRKLGTQLDSLVSAITCRTQNQRERLSS